MVFAAYSEMCRRMWRSARRMWKLHDLQTLSTCSLNDSVSSIVTPKLQTLLTDGLTLTQPRSTVLTNPSIRFRALVPITMASVLSGFIDKPLRSSQCWTARKHSDSLGVEFSSLSAMYSCVSSANCAWLTPNELMTFHERRDDGLQCEQQRSEHGFLWNAVLTKAIFYIGHVVMCEFLLCSCSCLASEAECEKLRDRASVLRRKFDDTQAALQELGRENQTLQVNSLAGCLVF